jgi:glucose dehydrogenase
MMIVADDDIDVVIVGAGFAGALIANELAKKGKRVVILEAGAGVPSDINDYMRRFYKAEDKVPESPYTPSLSDKDGHFDGRGNDPSTAPAGRPTVLNLKPKEWNDPAKSYFEQIGQQPFSSTYDRVAGGTSHWLGTCLRLVPNDFRLGSLYGGSVPQFVDWPIGYDDLVDWYGKAEAELGVSANVGDQGYLGIYFPTDYRYPMPAIPESLTDKAVRAALKNVSPQDTAFLKMPQPPTEIEVRGLPAARNSQPYRNRRACAGNTNCIPICPIQAKYDPTITLNEALSHKHVSIMAHTVASEIVLDDALRRVTEIKYIRYSTGPTQDRHEGSIRAKLFVIASNAIETPRLLLMSTNGGRLPKGVANTSGLVGCHLMDHPYYVAWGQLPATAKPLWPYRGPLITSGIGDLCDGPFRGERGAFRGDIGNEAWNFVMAGLVGSDPHATTIDFVNGVSRTGLNRGRNGVGMFGPALTAALNSNISRQFRVGFLVEQTPHRENCVKLSTQYKDGLGLWRPQISYALSPYTKRGIAAARLFKDLLFRQMGATEFTRIAPDDPSRFVEQFNGQSLELNFTGAGHIMGTYRMGFNDGDSVVDSFQRSHDHDNLYLVGSGTFPTGATANPTLTIAALALRTADRIATRI